MQNNKMTVVAQTLKHSVSAAALTAVLVLAGVASGMAQDAPNAVKARAKPNSPALRWACSWTQGTRVANEPVTAPCTVNTAATAYRARRTSVGAYTPSLMVRPLPDPRRPHGAAVNYQEPCLIDSAYSAR